MSQASSTESDDEFGLYDLSQEELAILAEQEKNLIKGNPTMRSFGRVNLLRSTDNANASIKLGKHPRECPPASEERECKKPKSDTNEAWLLRLNPIIIAHDFHIEELIRRHSIPFGAQFELARLVSTKHVDYGRIHSAPLSRIGGSNAKAAPEVSKILSSRNSLGSESAVAFSDEIAARSPWRELDLEEAACHDNPYGAIGNNPNFEGWYGGKVHFRGSVKQATDGKYKIELEHPCLGSSCRLTRRFGSFRMLRIRVPFDMLWRSDSDIRDVMSRPLVLWGRIYRAFFAKEQTVFFMACNEIVSEGAVYELEGEWSLYEYLVWMNPLDPTNDQKLCKWASRMALFLSNSVPGPLLKQEDVMVLPDIVSSEDSDMTDGCGVSNMALHLIIRESFKLGTVPTAIQCRLAGNKGMLSMSMIHEKQRSPDPRVWFRPSQIKIFYNFSQPLDPSLLTIDVLRVSRMKSRIRLSPEVIINLHHNGVPEQVFQELQRMSLLEQIDPLMAWEGNDAMFNLWCAVEQSEGVLSARRAREAIGEARINGYGDPEEREDEEDDDDGELGTVEPQSSAWWTDQTSGCPSSMAETVMVLLDSGFTPQDCPVLRERLKNVVAAKVKARTKKCKFEVPLSTSAFAVPDIYGVLKEDEIQIKSSRRNLKKADGTETNIILGDVLITRNPCKVPTDVRKVKAVEHPALNDWVDVIVCSINGLRRLIDYLAGGDYDGDVLQVFWEPMMVRLFVNAHPNYSLQPKGLEHCFTSDPMTVAEFCAATSSETSAMKAHRLQHYLLGALADACLVGQYSSLHDNAIYARGYGNKYTVKLAYKFCRVLDRAKTGDVINPETRKDDSQRYGHIKGPRWKASHSKDVSGWSTSNDKYLARGNNLPPFIMDILQSHANKLKTEFLKKIDSFFDSSSRTSPYKPDDDLISPWRQHKELAKKNGDLKYLASLDIISEHVQRMEGEYSANLKLSGGHFTLLKIEKRQDILRTLSQEFASYPKPEDLPAVMDEVTIARLRASFAYFLDFVKRRDKDVPWSRFPWTIAMRDLCDIKARSLGPTKTVNHKFYERFMLSKGWGS